MKQQVHIFFANSYFHVIIAHSIIISKSIPKKNIYFVTTRGTKLPEQYEHRLLIDIKETETRSLIRRNLKQIQPKIKQNNKHIRTCAYIPFQYSFPVLRYFDDYYFIEEGFSSCRQNQSFEGTIKTYIWQLLFDIKNKILNIGLPNHLLGLYFGNICRSPYVTKCKLIRISETAYDGIHLDENDIITIPICKEPIKKIDISNSLIIVMDKLTRCDAMYEKANLLRSYAQIVKGIDIKYENIYLKLHPADYKNEDAHKLISSYLGFLDFKYINEGLEDIALSNNNNIFLGTQSTILYYAPILGCTNHAISMVRTLSSIDNIFNKHLQMWGGLEMFCKIYSKHVMCI